MTFTISTTCKRCRTRLFSDLIFRSKGEHKGEAFVKINPHATVPAATHGDLTLTESNAVLMYAVDLDGGSPAYPKDFKQRADCNRWLLWEASVWFGTNYVYLVEYVVKPLLGTTPDEAVINKESETWYKGAAILEARLQKTGKFLIGAEPSLADFAIAAPMHMHAAQKLPLEKYPALRTWLSEIEKIPAWQKTQGAVDRALLPAAKSSEVRAEFKYTRDLGEKLTELYFYEDPKSVGIYEPGADPRMMSVTDGWYRANSVSIDKEGSAVKGFRSQYPLNEFANDTAVREKFYPEVVDFLKKITSASKVLVFDHTIRSKVNAQKKLTQETNASQRAPVRLVHCDYMAESGPVRVRQLLGDEADALLSRRVSRNDYITPYH